MTGSAPGIAVAASGPRPRRARLGRYASFQLRDFVAERLAGVTLVLALMGYASYAGLVRGTTVGVLDAGGEPARDIAMLIILTLLAQSWLFITLVAVNGLVSNDRVSGRFRFTFAKPARPAHYYLQGFVLHGLCMLACVAIAGGIIMALTAFDPGRLALTLGVVAAGYVLVGGICFAASTLWRLDWLATGLVLAVTLLARSRWPEAAFLHVLPPIRTVDEQLGRITASTPLQGGALLHVVLYGLACILVGLVVLHRRPLAR